MKRAIVVAQIFALLFSAVALASPTELPPARTAAMDIDSDIGAERTSLARSPGPGDSGWRFYNNRIDGNRYSDLAEIDAGNVGQLEEACRVHISGTGPFSAGTIVVDNILYTTSWRETLAIEPSTCDVIWKSIYAPEEAEVYNANRGAAFLDGRLFRGTGDGRLLAYEAATGRELWRRKIADPKGGEYLVAAPLAWQGKVFIGLSGGDFGIAGRMMAFDARTGAPLWSFNTIPRPGEFGNDSWPGDSWKSGGGGTWSSFSLDPATGELFVPVANPAPDFDPAVRRGDNLFTNSMLVLDAATGKRRWHYQARKNDNHDYGVASPAVLVTRAGRPAVAQASKDGFVYLIDRASHALIWKAAVTTILNHDADATEAGVKICPGAKGGVEYNSPGYDPQRGLLVTGSVDWCYKLRTAIYGPHVPGQPYMGGRMERADDAGTGWITALDVTTGKVRWRYHTPSPVVAAITPTAGGITFAGDSAGTLFAFRTADGALLRKIATGGSLAGGIVTYRSGGQQYLAVNSGNVSRSSWGAAGGTPTLIVYRLPKHSAVADADPAVLVPDAKRGAGVFRASCAVCHGAAGAGAAGPDLRGVGAKYSQAEAAHFIANPPAAMPKLYPSTLTAQDVADVAGFVRGLAR